MPMKATLCALFCGVATLAAGSEDAAPAPAPVPALKALHVSFEITNINYYDLTKVTCPKKPKMMNVKPSKPKTKAMVISPEPAEEKAEPEDPPPPPPAEPAEPAPEALQSKQGDVSADKAIEDVHKGADNVGKEFAKAFGGADAGKPPWMQDKDASFMQMSKCVHTKKTKSRLETESAECTTVMVILRDAIKQTVSSVIDCLFAMQKAEQAAGPAGAAPAPAAAVLVPLPSQAAVPVTNLAFLQSRDVASAPAPAAAKATEPNVKVFVTFQPGRKVGQGRGIIVLIDILDRPGNGFHDMTAATPLIKSAFESGQLTHEIHQAVHVVTGIKPKMANAAVDTAKKIPQWPIQECEKHITSIVNGFTTYYTRAQVPMALYNECTNFMTRLSFSHDRVLDPVDTVRCRKATAKFAKHWNYGENAKEEDFVDMCGKACEAKYGKNAPQCNVVFGDKMLNKPA